MGNLLMSYLAVNATYPNMIMMQLLAFGDRSLCGSEKKLPRWGVLVTDACCENNCFPFWVQAGICALYERKLKELNPAIRNLSYDIADLYNFIDGLADMSALVGLISLITLLEEKNMICNTPSSPSSSHQP
ncbi:hypothetical protein V8G54_035288 [Vigna mungo]|uniref:Uncharacterized protein n=1 Tax=Vigna mungo TaxID=3915 RepID=A0AAQ3MGA1_VIGMU